VADKFAEELARREPQDRFAAELAGRTLSDMTWEELNALEPAEHGNVRRVGLLDDPLLGALSGGAIVGPARVGRAAIAAGKGAAKLAGIGSAGAVGAYVYNKLLGGH
jgi:hypothetical protein